MKIFSNTEDFASEKPDFERQDLALIKKIAELDLPESCDPVTIVRLLEESSEDNTIDASDIMAIHEHEDARKIISVLRKSGFLKVKMIKEERNSEELREAVKNNSRVLTREEEAHIFRTIETEKKKSFLMMFSTPVFFNIIRECIELSASDAKHLRRSFDHQKAIGEGVPIDASSDEDAEKENDITDVEDIQKMLGKWAELFQEMDESEKGELSPEKAEELSDFLIDTLPLRKKITDLIFNRSTNLFQSIINTQKSVLEISDRIMKRPEFLKVFVGQESSSLWVEALVKRAGTGAEPFLESRLEALRRAYETIEDEVNMPVSSFREKNRKISASSKKIAQQYDILYRHNEKLIHSMMNKIYKKSNNVEYCDVFSEASIGLLTAIDKFDYKKGNKFSTYARNWIMAHINVPLRAQNADVRIPNYVQSDLRKMVRIENDYGKLNEGLSPSDEFIAGKLSVSLAKVRELKFIKSNLSQERMIRLDGMIDDDGDGDRNFSEVISDEDDKSSEEIYRIKQLQTVVRNVCKNLPPFDEEMIMYSFGIFWEKSYTLYEIGRKFKMNEERVRLAIKNAKAKFYREAKKMRLYKELNNECKKELIKIMKQ